MLATHLKGVEKVRIADFVHGSDGLGNTNPNVSQESPIALSGPEFMVQKVNELPGQVSIIALGPLTNVAKVRFVCFIYTNMLIPCLFNIFCIWIGQAVKLDQKFHEKVAQIVVLGGAFSVNGNVNPAAEANVSFNFFSCLPLLVPFLSLNLWFSILWVNRIVFL